MANPVPPDDGGAQQQQIGLVGQPRPSTWTNHMLDWIALADPKVLPDSSARLYLALRNLAALEAEGVDDLTVQVTHENLAKMLHRSVDSIQRALKPLYAAGLIEDRERDRVSRRRPGARPVVSTHIVLQVNNPVEQLELRQQVRRTQYVYLIGGTAELVKIGLSDDIPRRLAQLQKASPTALRVLWQTDGSRHLEQALHRRFHRQRQHGEWFDFGSTDPVVAVRRAVAAIVLDEVTP